MKNYLFDNHEFRWLEGCFEVGFHLHDLSSFFSVCPIIEQEVCHQPVFFSKACANVEKADEIGVRGEEKEAKCSNRTATFHCMSVYHKVEESIDMVGIKGCNLLLHIMDTKSCISIFVKLRLRLWQVRRDA